jgi:hypothetical protein
VDKGRIQGSPNHDRSDADDHAVVRQGIAYLFGDKPDIEPDAVELVAKLLAVIVCHAYVTVKPRARGALSVVLPSLWCRRIRNKFP